ncbi:MAG: hypothetical protein KAU62_17270, partial [Candidatus Heimdallarchaeota archaeon]|nr:hypothetical protein [Candidatus Heimdallarchaeota archaeon]
IGISGSLKSLLKIMEDNKIAGFSSLDSFLSFQTNWKNKIEQKKEQFENKYQLEISKIKAEHQLYENKY